MDALIFVGACGVAVRSIAPFVRDKKTDPAVLCLDERASFVIPLLSGHIGGANALAARLAGALGAKAVITTATDVNGKFAVDAWAAQNGCAIEDFALAKRFAAEILEHDLPLCSEFPVCPPLPGGVAAAAPGQGARRGKMVLEGLPQRIGSGSGSVPAAGLRILEYGANLCNRVYRDFGQTGFRL